MPLDRAVARVEDAIVMFLLSRATNSVPGIILKAHLTEYDDATIREALENLTNAKRIFPQVPLGDVDQTNFRLSSYQNYPVRKTIRVGNVEVPRVLSEHGVANFPEYFNEAVERLAEYTAAQEKRFGEIVRDEQRSYWSTIVTVFGVFVAIMALVLVSLPRITVGPSTNPGDIVLLNSAQVLPVAAVLFLFVLALRWVTLWK